MSCKHSNFNYRHKTIIRFFIFTKEIHIPVSWHFHVSSQISLVTCLWFPYGRLNNISKMRMISISRVDKIVICRIPVWQMWYYRQWPQAPASECSLPSGWKSPHPQSMTLITLWRHQMETFSVLLALCEGNPPVASGFPSQRPMTRSFDVFFDQCLNKWLSKQSRRRWFETPSPSLYCHCNDRCPSPQTTNTAVQNNWKFTSKLGTSAELSMSLFGRWTILFSKWARLHYF